MKPEEEVNWSSTLQKLKNGCREAIKAIEDFRKAMDKSYEVRK